MASRTPAVLERVRQPEYTGENRCLPCTIVNVVIAAVVSALLAVAAFELAAPAVAVGVGLAVFALSALAIYLRGYLVPGTPALTKRYLPDRVLALFDKDPADPSFETVERVERERRDAVDPEQFLLEAGAVEPCEREDDLCFTDEFADAIAGQVAAVREQGIDRATLAAVFDADPDDVEPEERSYPVFRIDGRIRKWPSPAAQFADVAADLALRERTDRWTAVPLGQRLDILQSLRSFHETCPDCGGAVDLRTETVESCCRSREVAGVDCADCEQRLLELDASAVEAAAPERSGDASGDPA